ncbi:MAG: DUF1549 and DUF1553 domain-containing protein [Fimbriiglobus sp.]|jgi:hypothetical protein|nr:DUF1549 and DUF1553 domain-containing protein [Fimbriiglobus sp.]
MSRSFPLVAVLLTALPALADDPPKLGPEHWAYKPVSANFDRKAEADKTHPVDAFVQERLKKEGMTLSPVADKTTLLRRVTFDLTGLPPTPEELGAFLKDDSAEAFEKVVDRLLKSPHFGERAALFWLDVVRYAESDGFKADDPRPNAWRYRDYVIQSFNADKPYDRFVMEQIAGDELYPNDPDAIVATGFLRHYPDEYNAVNCEQRRQEILNDITDTVGVAFLGVTLGCARCHDHKTDPIPTEDYYRLQAAFVGFKPVEVALDANAQVDYERRRAVWEQKTADVRKKMADIEKPYREKAEAKERMRFDPDYAKLLDVPEEKCSPKEKQIRAMVAAQVYSTKRVPAASLAKGPDKDKWDALAKELAAFDADKPKPVPTAMAMSEVGPVPPDQRLLKRGNWQKPGEKLTPGALSVFAHELPDAKPTDTTSGRRAALAGWIASKNNPLTARVAVNRVWQQHFGRGIAAASADLGATGDTPTHPELLDWLASELMARGWSLKHIHRLIVTSATYQQTSRAEAFARIDPDNKLLWRQNRKRLDGEALRDSLLAVSGQLNRKFGGPSVFPELPTELREVNQSWKPSANLAERNRRSIYVAVRRNLRFPLFALFDSPERVEACSRRFVTTTAPQALALMNDSSTLEVAKALGERAEKAAGDPKKVPETAFTLAVGRPPTTEELAVLADFMASHKGTLAEAATDLCHSLLNLNEFLYVD